MEKTQTQFRYEREMVAPARKWLFEQGMMVKEEFATPWGICDLVAVSLNDKRVRERLFLGQRTAIGPLIRVEILNAIPEVEARKQRIISEIVSSYHGILNALQIRAEVERLIAGKFIKEEANGAIRRVNGWMPLHRRIVALELKVSRVQDALAQATSHRAFAEESYVGLPRDLADRVAASRRAEAFRAEGVGILSITKNRCKVLLHACGQRYPLRASLQMHCVERFWRSRLKGNAS